MIELVRDTLVFSFPNLHRDAVLRVQLERTRRLPAEDLLHPLPAFGRLPIRSVHRHAGTDGAASIARDGVVVALAEHDAMWLELNSPWGYPFAVQVAVGWRDALSGEAWRDRLARTPQNYVVVPTQRILAGWCREGKAVQFVATETAVSDPSRGVLQLAVQPLRAEVWERARDVGSASPVCYADAVDAAGAGRVMVDVVPVDDPFDVDDWEPDERSRCLLYAVGAATWPLLSTAPLPETSAAPDIDRDPPGATSA